MNTSVNAIDDLLEEHQAVLVTLNILERLIAATDHGDAAHAITQLLEFFAVFVDRCHHAKEEDLLFPALEQLGVKHAEGPIGVMLSEHEQGRAHVAQMQQAFSGHQDQSSFEHFRKHARAYIDLLRGHIDKENQMLFPLATRLLSAERQAALKAGFDDIEATKIGPGRHEQFHSLIERLAEKYLA